jgi:hypothetical protein
MRKLNHPGHLKRPGAPKVYVAKCLAHQPVGLCPAGDGQWPFVLRADLLGAARQPALAAPRAEKAMNGATERARAGRGSATGQARRAEHPSILASAATRLLLRDNLGDLRPAAIRPLVEAAGARSVLATQLARPQPHRAVLAEGQGEPAQGRRAHVADSGRGPVGRDREGPRGVFPSLRLPPSI